MTFFIRTVGGKSGSFDCGLIDAGIIVTRAEELNDIFKALDIITKYGASTTWMGKLTYRLKGFPKKELSVKDARGNYAGSSQ